MPALVHRVRGQVAVHDLEAVGVLGCDLLDDAGDPIGGVRRDLDPFDEQGEVHGLPQERRRVVGPGFDHRVLVVDFQGFR